LDFTGAQASGANFNPHRRSVNNGADALQIWLPGSLCPYMRVTDLISGAYSFGAYRTNVRHYIKPSFATKVTLHLYYQKSFLLASIPGEVLVFFSAYFFSLFFSLFFSVFFQKISLLISEIPDKMIITGTIT